MFLDIDFDGIRTRKEPSDLESDALPLQHDVLQRSEPYGSNIGFSLFWYSFFLSYKYVYLSLNWHSFTWNQKNPDQVNKPFP